MALQSVLPFIGFVAAGPLLAALLVGGNQLVLAGPGGEKGTRRWLTFWSLAASVLLLAVAVIAYWGRIVPDSGQAQMAAIFGVFALGPVIIGVLAYFVANWRAIASRRHEADLLLLPLALMLVLVTILASSVTLVLLVGALLLALIWQLQRWAIDLLALLLLAAFLPVLWTSWDIQRLVNAAYFGLSGVLYTLFQTGLSLVMLLSLALPALLVYTSLKPGKPANRAETVFRLSLAALLLAVITYSTYTSAFWASVEHRIMEDNFPFQAILSVAFGFLLAMFLPGRRRIAGLVYAFLAPALLIAAFGAGWDTNNIAVTQQRAERISQALELYQQRNGSYPETLAELSPAYLLRMPSSAGNFLDRGWCYQGGPDYYRLGYIAAKYGMSYQVPALSVQVAASAGSPPESGWTCAEKIPILKQAFVERY